MGLLSRLRERLTRRFRQGKVVAVAVLPKPAKVLGGAVKFQMPADFRIRSHEGGKSVFSGSKTGLRLTVTSVPFPVKLERITAADLLESFGEMLGTGQLPKLRRLRIQRCNALRADFTSGDRPDKVLLLIRRGNEAIVMLTEGITPENAALVSPMLASVRMHSRILQR